MDVVVAIIPNEVVINDVTIEQGSVLIVVIDFEGHGPCHVGTHRLGSGVTYVLGAVGILLNEELGQGDVETHD